MAIALSPLDFDPTPWEGLLAEVARRHQVPGIVAGVLHLDPDTDVEQRFVASTGVTNTRTGVESDRSTLCQIGSITKVITATMILQLRDEGRLDLDTKVVEILPDFALAGDRAGDITVEHLLTHTSGIDGDLFTDTGRGDDCVEKYVATLATADSLFEPGTGWSYCNSGFVVAGRIIEVIDERTWDESLRERIVAPLGLEHFFTMPEDIMAHRHQFGHVRAPESETFSPAPTAQIMRSMGPAGIVTSSVDDLLSFGAAFLRRGRSTTGAQLLSSDTVELMTTPRVDLVPAAASTAPKWGLGWMIDDWDSHRVYWHGGTTIGNNAWFQVLPEDGLVFVVFCNGGVAPNAAPEVYGAFARVFAGITTAPAVRPVAGRDEVDIDDRQLGAYKDASTTVTLTRTSEGVSAQMESRLGLSDDVTSPTMDLYPSGIENRFLARPDALTAWAPFSCAEVDGKEVLYAGIRCLPRQQEQPTEEAT